MPENYYNDLREFIEVLDRQGLLYRWQRLVNKDSELMPLMRLQYRGRSDAERQAFLYENVTDGQGRRYGIKVLTGVYAASRKIVGLGMGCKDPGEIYERWRHAVDKPIDPVVVESGPVHEEVHVGVELEKVGLSMLPAPVEEPGFSGDTRVTGPFITEDSASGVRNVGMYSGHFRPPNRLLAGIGPSHHAMLYHYPSAKRRRESLPVAIVLGALPDINYVAAANLPYGLDELSVAGGIRRRTGRVGALQNRATRSPG
jgi:4-hydroxy-3-polyprenylbenzoate decarboxylase